VFINGLAGERFAVRNSGARAVVEGIGDHGCEYMTGGVVVVLGKTGRNFAAGMSGGIAYVLDEEDTFSSKVNKELVEVSELSQSLDISEVYNMIEEHYKYTDSVKAKRILDAWDSYKGKFKKIIPTAYKLILENLKQEAEAKAASK